MYMQGCNTDAGDAFGRMIETTDRLSNSFAGITHGLMSGTRVASNLGWRAVDAIGVGDQVLTFDNAMQTVVEIHRESLWLGASEVPEQMWPVTIPTGALGNSCEISLLPDQGILIESEAAADALGDPFAVIPAMALIGLRGMCRTSPPHQVEIITLFFEQDEVIYLEGGTLAFCPHLGCLVTDSLDQAAVPYDVWSLQDAAFLVESMAADDDIYRDCDTRTLAVLVA